MEEVSGSLAAHRVTIVVGFVVVAVAIVGSSERLNVVQSCGKSDVSLSQIQVELHYRGHNGHQHVNTYSKNTCWAENHLYV